MPIPPVPNIKDQLHKQFLEKLRSNLTVSLEAGDITCDSITVTDLAGNPDKILVVNSSGLVGVSSYTIGTIASDIATLQSDLGDVELTVSALIDISGSLYAQIVSNDGDITNLQLTKADLTTVASISGALQDQINSIDVSGDISAYVDPISASLQTQIWSNDTDIATISGDLSTHENNRDLHYAITRDVTQNLHGFSIQQAVYYDGTDWNLANSSSITTIGTGLISSVDDANNFTVTLMGEVTGLTGLSGGHWYYVSETVDGEITTESGSIYSNPIMYSINSSEGIMFPLRADVVTGDLGLTSRSEFDSSNLAYLYTGRAVRGTLESLALWRISRFDFTDGTITYADGNENFDNIWNNRESLSYA